MATLTLEDSDTHQNLGSPCIHPPPSVALSAPANNDSAVAKPGHVYPPVPNNIGLSQPIDKIIPTKAGKANNLTFSPHENQVQPRLRISVAETHRGNAISLVRCTVWVSLGICLMLAGTILVHRYLLPRIYRCPDGATCRHNLDPRGHIIPRVQTLMQYWLQAGIVISGVGLLKLISYNSRLVLQKNGATILALERASRAIDGSWQDAALQLKIVQKLSRCVLRLFTGDRDNTEPSLQRGTTFIGILSLSFIFIGLFISFVVGFSIPDLQSTTIVHVPFTYPSSFTLPRADTRFYSTDEHIVGGVLDNWLVMPNTPHRSSRAFDGTLVIQDNRTIFTANSQASGSHITGGISCGIQGWNASILPLDSEYLVNGHAALRPGAKAYNISNDEFWFVTYSYVSLASALSARPDMTDSITMRQYLWAGNTKGVIPNATASADGGLFFAACNHSIYMEALPAATGPDTQTINPSQPIIFTDTDDPYVDPCPSADPLACVSWSVDDIIASWWSINLQQHDLVPFSCLSGVLAGYDGLSDTTSCELSVDKWINTLSTTLSALIFSAPLSGRSTQVLSVSTEAMSKERWWIQIILPGATFLLYAACLAYTWHLCIGQTTANLQKLDLVAVLCAKQYILDTNNGRNSTIILQ